MFNWYLVGAMLMRAKTILMRGHRADEICNFARAREKVIFLKYPHSEIPCPRIYRAFFVSPETPAISRAYWYLLNAKC